MSLRDAIANAYTESDGLVAGACTCGECGEAIADMVLALPEMQAIRQYIEDTVSTEECGYDHHGYCQAHMWFETDPACPEGNRGPAILADWPTL